MGSLGVSFYAATTTGPRDTLHSERIKLAASVLQSTNEYGCEMRSFLTLPDKESSFTLAT
jgi:hypothetical protein